MGGLGSGRRSKRTMVRRTFYITEDDVEFLKRGAAAAGVEEADYLRLLLEACRQLFLVAGKNLDDGEKPVV